ncbi:hypothetical protein Ciccas_009196 [Cichlidogyrus casuarinus]|uniref:CBS domain-containing protein n=1 Tax=Cichlidogyrus casuarinus TaxID=1844966 RepID=A0ABD2PXY8_9PLAT
MGTTLTERQLELRVRLGVTTTIAPQPFPGPTDTGIWLVAVSITIITTTIIIITTGMENDNQTYAVLFQHTPCYDLIPDCAKLVTLDSQLTIAKAFRALIANGLRAAPVWNSKKQTFTGVLAVTDFIQMLNICYRNFPKSAITSLDDSIVQDPPSISVDDLELLTLDTWKGILKRENIDQAPSAKKESAPDQKEVDYSSDRHTIRPYRFNYILPEDSIYNAVKMLSKMKVHRLPVVDCPISGNGNPLFMMTHHRLLYFLHQKQRNLPRPQLMNQYLGQNIQTAKLSVKSVPIVGIVAFYI